MKQLNKLTRYLMIAFAALTIVSCSKKTDEVVDKADPKLLSFGFYAEDNEDNLFRDYVVSTVTGNAIQIELPKDADRTKLVARFTTTDNATVTVSGVPQQSGTTKTNFSTPVDYIITEGKTNARYTVTIANAADYVWTKVGTYEDNTTTGDYYMKVNLTTGEPYFAYKLSATETADQKAYVVKYQNGWSSVGGAISAGRIGGYLGLTFNNEGQPYVTYPDYTGTVAQSPSVHYYNGSTWARLGDAGLFSSSVTYTALGINPANNQPILFNYLNSASGGPLARRALAVSSYNGTTWSIASQVTGRPESLYSGPMKTKTVGDILYLAVFNSGGTQTYSVYTYKQGTWTTIIDKKIEDPLFNSYLSDIGMDVDHDGNIYIVIADNADGSGTYKLRVKKYTASTATWSQVGNLINVDVSKGKNYSIAVSPSGTPHVLYRNDAGYPIVVAFDTEAKDWGTPKVLEEVASKSTNVYLDFAADGTGYASYINTPGNIVLYKYDAAN